MQMSRSPSRWSRIAVPNWLVPAAALLFVAGIVVWNRLPEWLESNDVGAGIKALGGTISPEDVRSADQVLVVNLPNSRIDDEGMQLLVAMSNLEHIDLSNTRITDAGVACLAGATSLRSLELSDTGVTDVGLHKLAGLTQLRNLAVNSTAVSDRGLSVVAGMPLLKGLDIENTQVTDAGLVYVGKLKNLQMLSVLGNRGVTDRGLEQLHELHSLRFLQLRGTGTSPDGIERLERALPSMTVEHQ